MAQGPQSEREPVGSMAVRAYGKYFLVRKLAEGGMAEIFLAKQVGVEGFEKNVVIKRMLQHLSQVNDFVSMFLDEARLAASLNHPNIVQITDLGQADGCYYICMEHLAGEDFATVLRIARRRNEHVPLHIVLRVIAEAAMGLHYAHEATDNAGAPLNIVHRDISPSNIFIGYTGQVKVLDFGIAKAESRVTTTTAGIVKGKYQYMSPEQASSSTVDRRADVYSLGVSLFEALTGVRPFAHDTDLAILNAVLKHEFPELRKLRPDLPAEVEGIVLKAMALKPADRYQSAAELAADIEHYIGATTSASGGKALATYMRATFGEERLAERTKIPSLHELAAQGVDVPGMPNPLGPRTDVGANVYTAHTRVDHRPEEPTRALRQGGAAEVPTRAVAAPAGLATEPPPRSRRGVVVLALIGALVLGVVGSLVVVKVLRQGETGPRGQSSGAPDAAVAVPVPVPVPVVDAGPEPADAGPSDVVIIGPTLDAGAPAVDVAKKQRPVELTAALVNKVITATKPRFEKCFKDNKKDLPAPKGTLKGVFIISAAGRVTSASTELTGTGVGRCVEGAMKAMRFPVNVGPEWRVPLALNYDVQ